MLAFWIAMVLPLLVGVLDTVFAYLTNDATTASVNALLERYGVPPTPPTPSDWLLPALVSAVLAALWIAFGFPLRAGRQWARVTLAVFAALWLFAELMGNVLTPVVFAVLGGEWDLGLSTGMLVVLVLVRLLATTGCIVFLVLVFSRRSNEFFRAPRPPHPHHW
ncbi:hypothetical protein HUO13_24070 [Saccharopolyspora erythraea]|nr:hypothetical protein HUO13_24070 [Saccharopolyspora erythraea]